MESLFPRLEALIPALMQDYGVPGVGISIVKGDEVVYAGGFGLLAQGKPEPVNADSLFGIGSCTKAFTATIVGMLVQEGKLGGTTRDEIPARLHCVDPVATREITVRDLVPPRGVCHLQRGFYVVCLSLHRRRSA